MSYHPPEYDSPEFAGLSQLEIEGILSARAEERQAERLQQEITEMLVAQKKGRAALGLDRETSPARPQTPLFLPDSDEDIVEPFVAAQESPTSPVATGEEARSPVTVASILGDPAKRALFGSAWRRLGSAEERDTFMAGVKRVRVGLPWCLRS
jgi:hypothetical protein